MKYITYLDKNNWYSYAKPKPLPTGGFKWLDPEKFNRYMYDDCLRDCILEFDLEYSKD